MANETTNNEPQRIEAGEVLEITYKSENKPCDRALALLLSPIDCNSDIRNFHLLYSMDADTMAFLPTSTHKDMQASIHVATKEQRALYYEKMLEMLSKQNGKEVQP